MRQKLIPLLTIYLLFNSALSAQDIEKMNKSELREHIAILTTKIDSIKNENISLKESISKLSKNSALFEQKNKANEIEIIRLNELILKNENERKRIDLENETIIAQLNETILTLKDSISNVHSSSNVVTTSTSFNNNDFLNKYYFDQIPLPNNSFSLVLTKLIYGNLETNNRYYDDDNKGGVMQVPEILDPSSFTFWGVNDNVDTKNKNFNDLIFANNTYYLDSKLPKIEILKNKLFTLKYMNGAEESFLFNVKHTGSDDKNNQRGILQIELANEEVKEDGTNNTAKDMVWRFFVIGNECYLALNRNQLNRIGLQLQTAGKLEYFRNGVTVINDDFGYYGGTTTGNEIYLSRNKDSYMESSEYINPDKLIYLFKLK
ncbi:MAG: hypothetical protein FJZ43_04420 [Candidatus Staskawiczbacteria bacterium]|nr:hypothetical protein [Candidatus Staskawiczbacteria bacterium]